MRRLLGNKPPLSAYAANGRRYPRPVEVFGADEPYAALRVERDGCIRWKRRKVFISTALAYEFVDVEPDDDRWCVTWGPLVLGWIDDRRPDRGLILPPRRRRRR